MLNNGEFDLGFFMAIYNVLNRTCGDTKRVKEFCAGNHLYETSLNILPDAIPQSIALLCRHLGHNGKYPMGIMAFDKFDDLAAGRFGIADPGNYRMYYTGDEQFCRRDVATSQNYVQLPPIYRRQVNEALGHYLPVAGAPLVLIVQEEPDKVFLGMIEPLVPKYIE